MKRITLQRVALFGSVMTVVAFIVYLPHLMREQRQEQTISGQRQVVESEAASPKTIEAAAAQSAAYRAKYLNRGFRKQPNLKTVAIAVESPNREPDRPIADALASHLRNENLALFTSFFKPAFYADGLFNDVFAGSTESIYKLQLTNILDALLLAQEQVQYSTNGAAVANIVTANARLEVAFLPFGVMRMEQSWTFHANGAGFSPEQAKANAQERLIKQIEVATNMALLALPSENQESYP